jgi:hypothetical protein
MTNPMFGSLPAACMVSDCFHSNDNRNVRDPHPDFRSNRMAAPALEHTCLVEPDLELGLVSGGL